ncbi:MAG: T9SS type A sorting domain-containing protein [Bacteroidia bacterium]
MKKFTFLLICIAGSVISVQAQSGYINTVAGNGIEGYSGDGGQATAAELHMAAGVALDASGNLYIADQGNNRIRKVNKSGVITTVAGNGTGGYSGDGGQATAAELFTPFQVAVDAKGNLYIADNQNSRVRMVSSTGIITTIAGTGDFGYSGDGGPATAAEVNGPEGIGVDASGNVYVVDNANERIRIINTSGIITTIAGNGTGSYSGDGGQATAAEIYEPTGVSIDANGNLYIADSQNNRIRKVNTSGVISTVAGNGVSGFGGDGGQATAAELSVAFGIAVDANGNFYIGDAQNARIRMVNSSGVISTIAGDGTLGYSGDGGPATAAELLTPEQVAIDALGDIYVADQVNFRVRKVNSVTGISEVQNDNELRIYPNPVNSEIHIELTGAAIAQTVSIYSITGEMIWNETLLTNKTITVPVSGFASGIYIVKLQLKDGNTLMHKIDIVR